MKVLIGLTLILTSVGTAAISLMIGLGHSPLVENDVISFASNLYAVGEDRYTITHRLHVMDTERGLLHTIVEGMNINYHSWSPDGSRIAFSTAGDDGDAVYVVNQNGSGLRRIVSGGQMPVWQDAATLIFHDAHDSIRRYKVNIDESESGVQQMISLSPGVLHNPLVPVTVWDQLSSGEQRIAAIMQANYRASNNGAYAFTAIDPNRQDGALFHIYLVDEDGGNLRPLTSVAYRDDYFPAWRP
jgi:hypothetical protein